MSRYKADSVDAKTPAQLCADCGGWPALHRPKFKLAYCEGCQARRVRKTKKSK